VFYLEPVQQMTKMIVHFYIHIYLTAAQQDVSTEGTGRFAGVFILLGPPFNFFTALEYIRQCSVMLRTRH